MTGWWTQLRSMWRRPNLADVRVTLYTRRGCHLCDDAKSFLVDEQKRLGFILSEVDIDSNADLRERFDTCIPVIVVNDKERFRGGIQPILWRRLVQSLGK